MIVIAPVNVEAVLSAKMGGVVVVGNAAVFVPTSTVILAMGLPRAIDWPPLWLLKTRRLCGDSSRRLMLCVGPGPLLLLC
jgi:hypothetical protein